ncbi:MAG: 16S rRNA (guanine(527)-N(7))-methyltransferase RsmG [Gammaproteobacteria bacterium]
MSQELLKLLDTGISELDLLVSTDIQNQLIQYIELLHKWNQISNLTSVKNKKKMVSIHLLDSLAILPYITGTRILDVATGAGLPGIVLALCFPEKQFVLIDSNKKKIRFINQVVTELKIKNVVSQHVRIESFLCETIFDQIVSRAYTSLQAFIESTGHLADDKTEYLGMKGQLPELEIAELGAGYTVKSYPLIVPYIEGQRHLIIMTSNKNF